MTPTGEFLFTVTCQFQCGYRDMECSFRSKESNVSQRVGSPLDFAPTPKHPSNRLGIWLFCRPEFTKTSFVSWFGAWFTLVPNSQLANWSRVAPGHQGVWDVNSQNWIEIVWHRHVPVDVPFNPGNGKSTNLTNIHKFPSGKLTCCPWFYSL